MKDIIQSLWIGPPLSLIEILCIKSYLNLGYEFHLYTYTHIKNIPDGTVIKDANEILPESSIFKTHGGSVAHFADWFRWKMLFENGGIWVDMDLIAIQKFDNQEDVLFAEQKYNRLNISFLKFPQNHKLCKFMMDACENPNKILPYDNRRTKIKKRIRYIFGNKKSNIGWGESGGPIGFSKAVKYFNLEKFKKRYPSFYPIPPSSWMSIFDNTFFQYPSIIKESWGVHLWNELIRRDCKFNLKDNISPDSLFAYLLNKNGLTKNEI